MENPTRKELQVAFRVTFPFLGPELGVSPASGDDHYILELNAPTAGVIETVHTLPDEGARTSSVQPAGYLGSWCFNAPSFLASHGGIHLKPIPWLRANIGPLSDRRCRYVFELHVHPFVVWVDQKEVQGKGG